MHCRIVDPRSALAKASIPPICKAHPNEIGNRLALAAVLRHRAHQCEDSAVEAKDEPTRLRFERLAEGWKSVSQSQSWLDGEISPYAIPSEQPQERRV